MKFSTYSFASLAISPLLLGGTATAQENSTVAASYYETDYGYAHIPIEWHPCDPHDPHVLCGDIEFCQDGDNYGYRRLGDKHAPCGGGVPGPLIRFEIGKQYKLTLHNYASKVTNLHTHGLHVVGDGDGDDVTREAWPGDCLTYHYDINKNQPPGTNWYHPHYEGESLAQVTGGAFGMIIVDDILDDPHNPIPEWAEPENEFLLQVFQGASGSQSLGNGKKVPYEQVFHMQAHKWYRLRVSTVNAQGRTSGLWFPDECTVYKVASDGVWHEAGFAHYDGLCYAMTGSSRGDYAIKCSEDGSVNWQNSRVAKLKVYHHNSGHTTDTPPGHAPSKPDWMTGWLGAQVDEHNKKIITLFGTTGTLYGYEDDQEPQINGMQWDPDHPAGIVSYNEVQEWTIRYSIFHPFHTHLYHMQIASKDGCGDYKYGEFYDTIASAEDCVVRFKTANIGQRFVIHCHDLNHEAVGQIIWYDVRDVPDDHKNTNNGDPFKCPTNYHPYVPPKDDKEVDKKLEPFEFSDKYGHLRNRL